MTDYTLVRSRRRTLSMELKRDGTVVVHAPLRLGVEKIDAFVAAHEAWLARARTRQAERLAAHPEPTEAEREALLARARSELPQRVAHWSRVTGLVPTGVKITGAKTRFGSCNSKNSLCFSWRLMQYPDEPLTSWWCMSSATSRITTTARASTPCSAASCRITASA